MYSFYLLFSIIPRVSVIDATIARVGYILFSLCLLRLSIMDYLLINAQKLLLLFSFKQTH